MAIISRHWAALITFSLSLFGCTAADAIRRKRKYVLVEKDGEGASRSKRGDYFYRRGNLLEMPDLFAENRQLKSKSRKGGRKSRAGDVQEYWKLPDDEYLNRNAAEYTFTVSPPQAAETMDWDDMSNEELEYFFQIEHAKSYPDGDRPTNSIPTIPASSPRPSPKPTPKPTPTPGSNSSPPPTRKPTARPTTSPTTPRPTPLPTETSTRNPQPQPPSNTPDTDQACEDMSRRDALLMTAGEITDREVLLNPSTPQSQAFLWMLDDDPAQIDPCSYPTPLQRYILVTHYFATGGESWETSNGWLTEDGECIWLGINCNGSGGATRMELRENNLDGSLIPELSSLYSLGRLDLSGNSIRGEFVEMPSSLSFLDVERNALRGSPFGSLLALTGLRQLHISSNAFSGAIPPGIGELSSLEELWIANNQFGGSSLPSEVGKLENLETLFIYNAQVGGSLPSELGNLDLTEFLANNNRFQDGIPDELWNNNRLTLLRLDSNELTGSISSRLGELTDLTDLFLNNNALSSSLPVQMQRLTSLVNLLLNDNKFSGTIRDGFDSFRNLDFVDFSANDLTGTLPSTLFDIRDLRFLYLSNNNLDGPLPENWGNAVLLRDLFVDNNKLTGSVPEIPQGSFTRLTELLLNGNMFSGEMPGSICQLRSSAILEDLWADCGGTPPEIQCALPSCCTFCFE